MRDLPPDLPESVVQAVEHAHANGLIYVSAAEPGIARRTRGKGFHYLGTDGRAVTDEKTLQRIRKLDLKKTPSISETLDWVKALTLLNIKQLDDQLVNETLSTLMKYEADIRKAHQELQSYLAERRAMRGASGKDDKDHLH